MTRGTPMTRFALQYIPLPLKLFIVLLLSLLAFLGNYLNLPLVYGVDFIFGSIAAILALYLLGTTAALCVASMGGVFTLLLWGHPYALIILVVEALVVSVLYQKYVRNLIVADCLYWLLVGAPLVLMFYRGGLNMNWDASVLIAIKQSLNGVLNALIAGLIIIVWQITVRGKYALATKPNLIDILFSPFLLLLLLAGSVPIVYASHSQQQAQQASVHGLLNLVVKGFAKSLNDDFKQNIKQVNYHLDRFNIQNDLSIAIFNQQGDIVAQRQYFKNNGAYTQAEQLKSGLVIFMPTGSVPKMQRWRNSYYSLSIDLNAGVEFSRIEVALPAFTIVAALERERRNLLFLLMLIFVLSIALNFWLSKVISLPLQRMQNTTQNMESFINKGESAKVADHPIQEYSNIARCLNVMSMQLAQNFCELQKNKSELTAKVELQTQELKHTALMLQNTLDTILDGIITINEQGIIKTVNPAAVNMFGFSVAEMVGSNVNMLMPHSHSTAHDGYMQRYHKEGNARIIGIGRQLQGKRKNGQVFDMELHITQMQYQGGCYYVGSVRDITARVAVERQKAEFVSTVSHELRTPLTAMLGALDIIGSQKLGALNQATEKLIMLACKNSHRLKLLINDLLDLEKMSHGKLSFNIKPHTLQPMLEHACQSYEAIGQEQHKKIHLNTMQHDVVIDVDEARFQQVLTNLLSNAVKFSPDFSDVHVIWSVTGKTVRINVTDHGCGISQASKARIFERFYQADSSDSRKEGGTGLGLAICKELIEGMGGDIGFESEHAKGSTFWITLPLSIDHADTSGCEDA